MHIDQLKYLIEISNSPSINAASEKLHISYQALSHSIKSLESELNLSLLNRTYRGSELTQDGYRLVNLSKQFLSGIHQLQLKNKTEESEISGDVNILTSYICLENFLFDLMDSIEKKHPNIHFRYVVSQSSQDLLSFIDSHPDYIHIVFLGFLDLYDFKEPLNRVNYDIYTSEIRCMCSPMHELATHASISLKQLSKYKLLVRAEENMNAIRPSIIPKEKIVVETNPVLYERKIQTQEYIALTYKVPFAPYWLPQMSNVSRIPILTDNPITLRVSYSNQIEVSPQAKIFLNALFRMVGYNKTI